MNPYLSLSKFTLRLSSCSSLGLWNGVFLAWSLKFIFVFFLPEKKLLTKDTTQENKTKK